ncbi:hypothetical protein N0V82_009208 [Gnomoniopsis sp. IMI 355080]|nr:hypothetical protein N0V82_009208 [Gnomoniopsis sp. IMI 355080]
MFSSVAGAGSICLGCQLRAVTRRAAPVLAASAVAHTPTAIRRRRYASDSSEPSSSNDDFLTAIINEQRFDDGYEVSKSKKKRSRAKSKKQQSTFAQRSHSEPSPFYSDQEVGFEDVWDQDPELGEGVTEAEKPLGKLDGESDSAPVEQQSNEIDYGDGASSAEAHLHLDNYSWNNLSVSQLQEQYGAFKSRRPKKAQPQPQEPPATLVSDVYKKIRTKSHEDHSDRKSNRHESMPRKARVKHTDNLYDWGESNPATSQILQDDIGLELDERNSSQSQALQDDIELELDQTNSTKSQTLQDELEFEPHERPATTFRRLRLDKPQQSELRHYRRGDTKLVADLPQLPVETLGRDAPVIVLREQGPWQRASLKEDESPVGSSLNIEDYVDQEAGLSLDTIMENIDGLRPEHRILPAREFKDVFDILMKGFTAVHIETYIERNRQRLAEGDETPFLGVPPDELMSRPWIVSQSRWVPEVKGAVADVPHPLKGYILKTMPPKQRLVMQLMRECWGMSVQELLQGQGVLDLEVRDVEFRLLTLGNQRFLHLVSRLLGQGGGRSIQVIKSRRALQIIAPKAVAEFCLRALDEKLEKVRTKNIAIDQLPVKNMSDEMLEELGRITNSLIEVTWIDATDRQNSKLENMDDIVLRLILSAYPPVRTSKALTVYPDPAEQGRLVGDMVNKEKLPWNDRRLAWARLCLPITNKAKTPQLAKHWPLSESLLKYKIEPVVDDLVADDLIEPNTSTIKPERRAFYTSLAGVPLHFPRPPRESEEEQLKQVIQPTKPTLSGWLPFRVRTTAIFGHVLHLNNQYITASIKEGTDAVSTSRRTVSALLPPITFMDFPAGVPYKSPKNKTSLIIMRFIPTFLTPSSTPDGPAPSLELRIKATDEEIIGIDSLRAIAHTHVADICLPGDHVDVRATQRLVAELPGNKLDTTEGMQPLNQFLKDAVLEVGQGRLITPPGLDGLGLPSWLFYAPETDTQSPFLRSRVLAELYDAAKAASAPPDGSKPKKASKKAKKPTNPTMPVPAAHSPYETPANALTPTSYIFSGLEVHQSVETSYDGWKLSYKSVEAGGGGGRRAELELEAVPSADKDVRREGARIDAGAWLRSVYKLATGRVAKEKKADEEAEGAGETEKAMSIVKWVADKS